MRLFNLCEFNPSFPYCKIYVRHTGKELSYIEDNMERDKFMSPKEAMEFGLVDRILEHPPRQGSMTDY